MPRRRGYRSLPTDQETRGGIGSYRYKLNCCLSAASSLLVLMASPPSSSSAEADADTAVPAPWARSAAEVPMGKPAAVDRSQPRSRAVQRPPPAAEEEEEEEIAFFDVTADTIEMSSHSSFERKDSLIGSVLVIDNDECQVEREQDDASLVYTYSAEESGTVGMEPPLRTGVLGSSSRSVAVVGGSAVVGGPAVGGRPDVQRTTPATAPRRDDAPPTTTSSSHEDPVPRGPTSGSTTRSRFRPTKLDVFRKRSPTGTGRPQHDNSRGTASRATPPDELDQYMSRIYREPSPPRIFELANDPLSNAPRIQALFHSDVHDAGRVSKAERERHQRSDASTSATLTTASNSSASAMRSSTGGGSTASGSRSLSSLAYGRLIISQQQQHGVDELTLSSTSAYHDHHVRRSHVLDGFYVSE
jgi:hypothetical protein